MEDKFRRTEEDDVSCYREFVPGQPWMSRQQKKREDLHTTMNEIEVAISVLRHKTAALRIVYDILEHAATSDREDRNLAQEIKQALQVKGREESRRNRDRRQKDSLKTQSVQDDQMKETDTILEEAFKKIYGDIQINKRKQKYEEKKEEFDSKKEAFNNKTENLKDIGSYGSTLFRR